jgi:hypothetical protein
VVSVRDADGRSFSTVAAGHGDRGRLRDLAAAMELDVDLAVGAATDDDPSGEHEPMVRGGG